MHFYFTRIEGDKLMHWILLWTTPTHPSLKDSLPFMDALSIHSLHSWYHHIPNIVIIPPIFPPSPAPAPAPLSRSLSLSPMPSSSSSSQHPNNSFITSFTHVTTSPYLIPILSLFPLPFHFFSRHVISSHPRLSYPTPISILISGGGSGVDWVQCVWE